MNAATIAIALLWGAISGILAIHALANLLAVCFCLHGLIMTRWKRLADKTATGVVKYDINLNLLLRVALYALLFSSLLNYADIFIRKEFRFQYIGNGAILFAVVAACAALSRVNAMRKRSLVIWRMSHDFDFAEKRQRTQLLKS